MIAFFENERRFRKGSQFGFGEDGQIDPCAVGRRHVLRNAIHVSDEAVVPSFVFLS